ELAVDNLHFHRPSINCGLCHKPLSNERSVLTTLGPVCEHKVQNIVNDQSVEPQDFSSIYADPVTKGELLWLKTSEGNKFVEICEDKKDKVLVIDRKGLEKD